MGGNEREEGGGRREEREGWEMRENERVRGGGWKEKGRGVAVALLSSDLFFSFVYISDHFIRFHSLFRFPQNSFSLLLYFISSQFVFTSFKKIFLFSDFYLWCFFTVFSIFTFTFLSSFFVCLFV